jgi:predicted nucleic acid-binding protein
MWSNTSWAASPGPATFRTPLGTWIHSVSEIIVDTGPLVALLVRTDDHHAWVVDRLRELQPPFLTCEAVLAEVAHLVRRVRNGLEGFVDLLLSDLLRVEFDLMTERGAVGRLLRKYADRPMSLADACLVRLAELNDTASILTIDGDFAVYRKHGRRAIALISP